MRIPERTLEWIDTVGGARSLLRTARRVTGMMGGGYILAYHSITVPRFLEHLEALKDDVPVSLDDLVARATQGRPTAGMFAITFDDGYADTVAPLAQLGIARGIPMTFYLPVRYLETGTMTPLVLHRLLDLLHTGTIRVNGADVSLADRDAKQAFVRSLKHALYTQPERDFRKTLDAVIQEAVKERLLPGDRLQEVARPVSWSEVASLSTHEMIRFESHGMTHQSVISLDDGALEQEIVESNRIIAGHTRRPVGHFCYPFGGAESIGTRARAIVANHYRSAVTMIRGRIRGADPAYLPRIPMYEKDTPAIVRAKLLTW